MDFSMILGTKWAFKGIELSKIDEDITEESELMKRIYFPVQTSVDSASSM